MLTRIGDVARELGETEVTIRWWADQFGRFLGRHKVAGQRRFSSHAVEVLREAQRLIRVELFTLEGAKRQLSRKEVDVGQDCTAGSSGDGMQGACVG